MNRSLPIEFDDDKLGTDSTLSFGGNVHYTAKTNETKRFKTDGWRNKTVRDIGRQDKTDETKENVV